VDLSDYLIAPEGVDWSKTLMNWSWLVPAEFTLWLVNRLGDLFIVPDDGSVHLLDVGRGTLERLADHRDDFCRLIDESDRAKEWPAIPLVDQLVEAGLRLQPHQCYGFNLPPVLGGDYGVENIGPISIEDDLGARGSLHDPLRGVEDGDRVVLRLWQQSE
jgi:hypothetical protein